MKRTLRIQVKRRRFGFKVGATYIGLKEYRTLFAPARPLSFIVDADCDLRELEKIRESLRAEILKRISTELITNGHN